MSKYSGAVGADFVEKVTPAKKEQASRRVQLMIDAKMNVRGVSGKMYAFRGAGSIADVDINDVEYLLQKRQGGRQCCGGTEYGNQVFALVGD